MHEGEALERREITSTERYSQGPNRYTEASLVRKLEELGIGRPSTYAPTISTIQQREYVQKGDRKGENVSMLLTHVGLEDNVQDLRRRWQVLIRVS